jgi:hypothetical protein
MLCRFTESWGDLLFFFVYIDNGKKGSEEVLLAASPPISARALIDGIRKRQVSAAVVWVPEPMQKL